MNLCAQGDPDWRDFLLTYYKVTLSPWQQKQFYENPGIWQNRIDPLYMHTEESRINKLKAYLSSGDPTQNILALRFLSIRPEHVDEDIRQQLESYSPSSNPLLLEWIARARYNRAFMIAQLNNDPNAYLPVIESFGESNHPPVQEKVAIAMFNLAVMIAKCDNNPNAYLPVIEKFAKNEYPPVQEQFAKAMFNRAYMIAIRDNYPDAFLPVIEEFKENEHPPVQENIPRAMYYRALIIAKQKNNPDAYNELIEKFGESDHPPVQEHVARAMYNRALMIAERDYDPDAYLQVIDKFAENEHPPVQELVLAAKQSRIGWLVVAGRVEEALAEGEALLNDSGLCEKGKLVMLFLLWLAKPDVTSRKRLDELIRTFPDGKRSEWKFDEFAEVIAKLNPEARAFALEFIDKFEKRSSDD